MNRYLTWLAPIPENDFDDNLTQTSARNYLANTMLRQTCSVLLLFVAFVCPSSNAQAPDLQPKYGRASGDGALSADDQKFLADMDSRFKGDRKKASSTLATRGWTVLRQGKSDEAMQRFNQAWLLQNNNGNALWGMGQIQANRGKAADSYKLFGEANRMIGYELDFAVDYARAQSLAALELGDNKMLDEAFKRFAQLQTRAPQNSLNLQNWAIAYYIKGQYAAAWEKVKAAEATPRGGDLDKRFVADLQRKMQRP
jgi:tetratricopeptide (TPR) repeat protein